ncbi:hypothetical protein O988_02165 [Pseudogymnoascus sp. VKM F-3808]|nr:hypothetical protein O988_02165 [Pseudogymnoascus sp. VKM F-3808]
MDPMDAAHADKGPAAARKRRRNRPPVSCNHCRIRKLKCNRVQPCGACAKSGDASTCHYESRGNARDDQIVMDRSTKNALTTRINKLEAILRSVMGSKDQTPQSDDSSHVEDQEFDGITESLGAMKVDKSNNTEYLGSSHWVSILAEIDEIRTFFVSNHEDYERNALMYKERSWEAKGRSGLLRGTGPKVSQEELVVQLPPKAIVDILVDRYFSVYAWTMPIIHEPTFRKEYAAYWDDPSQRPIVWLGLLFAMLHLAELSYGDSTEMPPVLADALRTPWEFGKRTVECLIAADYTNPVHYTIETLMLYIEVEWMTAQDTGMEGYLVLGVTIRLAMRAGIHRNADDHRRIKPFLGEMRSRLWAVILRTDLLYSFKLTFPTTIRRCDYTCATPRNISNYDFDEDTVEFPPSKSLEEATEASYTIVKGRLLLVLGDIIELIGSRTKIRREDLQRHDEALLEARELVPQYLRVQPFTPTANDTETAKLQRSRIDIDSVYHLGRCLLYRKFVPLARRYPSAVGYRDNCIDAAMALLSHQAALALDHGATYPRNVTKRHFHRLTTHDFFLAAIIVALDLYAEVQHGADGQISSEASRWGSNRKFEMVNALEIALGFWRLGKDDSADAAKAYGVFSFVLDKVKATQWPVPVVEEPKIQLNNDGMHHMDPVVLPQERITEIVTDVTGFEWGMWNGNWNAVDDYSTLLQWPPVNSFDGQHSTIQ